MFKYDWKKSGFLSGGADSHSMGWQMFVPELGFHEEEKTTGALLVLVIIQL